MNDLHNLRTGLGMDVHAFAPGRKLILGGVDTRTIRGSTGTPMPTCWPMPSPTRCSVLCAGATSGSCSPTPTRPTRMLTRSSCSPRWLCFVRERGFEIIDVDSVIAAQAPKLSPYREAMRENLAAAMGVPWKTSA